MPVYDNPEGLRACLEGLRRQRDPAGEVIVADDASRSDPTAICETFGARCVRLAENRGPGAARNAAARAATGAILAFTDADCVPTPDWLSGIRRAFADGAVAAVAGGYGRDRSGTFWGELRRLEARFHHPRETARVQTFVAANFAVRREIFDAVGGFPERRVGEDLLLGLHLARAGFDVLWDPSLAVDQSFRPTLGAYFRQQAAWSAAVVELRLSNPEIGRLSWSVRRGKLPAEAVCAFLFWTSLAAAGAGFIPAWPAAASAAAAFGLKLPFARFLARERSPLFAAGALPAGLLARDTAWLAGALAGAVRRVLANGTSRPSA